MELVRFDYCTFLVLYYLFCSVLFYFILFVFLLLFIYVVIVAYNNANTTTHAYWVTGILGNHFRDHS